MYEVRDNIKTTVKELGRKLTDLSRELEMNYDSLNAYVNGRRQMPPEVEKKIDNILNKWQHSN